VRSDSHRKFLAVSRKQIVAGAAACLVVVLTALALSNTNGASGDGMRFEATFNESTASMTNRTGAFGVVQLVNTGTGTADPYGGATMVVGITQDRFVQPCGEGSWTNAATRRIALGAGVLVVRELVHFCPTASGLLGRGRWHVDGASSAGAFAGARGSGESRIDVAGRTSTLSGEIELDPTRARSEPGAARRPP
jgi:hypothetical protein